MESLAEGRSKSIISVAMGSSEGNSQADSAIAQGLRTGNWVLIKNAHLALSWLSSLEKRLHSMPPSEMMLFITVEINPGIPINLLRSSRIVVFEPSVGIRSSVLDSIASIPKRIAHSGPIEQSRILFMLAWLHAVVLERLRYLPVGWTKEYDFNDSDFELGASLINSWLILSSHGKSNLAPENIPWNAIQSLISQNVYGGKVDSPVDVEILSVLVKECFNPKIFDKNFALVSGNRVMAPNGISLDDFCSWTRKLEETQPDWVGLPAESDSLLKITTGISS